MLKIIVFAFVAILLVAVKANPLQPRLAYEGNRIPSGVGSSLEKSEVLIIALEEPCVLQGGLCVHYYDCDPENRVRVKADLCPIQKHLGATCCYR